MLLQVGWTCNAGTVGFSVSWLPSMGTVNVSGRGVLLPRSKHYFVGHTNVVG